MNLLKNQQRAEVIDRIYLDLEDQLMLNIARHLSDWEQTIDTDKWLMWKMAEIGSLNKENIRFIAKTALISEKAAQRMLEELAEETLDQLEPGFEELAKAGYIDETFKPPKSKNMEQVMDTMMDQAKEKMNITNTTMLHKAQEAFRGLASDIARNAMEIMNNNTAAMITGIKSRQQALERAIKQFAEKGITGFVDQRGRNWTPEAYVNMCMRTTAGTTANEIQTARCRDYGINLISIDAHSGSRPKCAKDQGKIFDLNNKSGTTEDLNGKKIKYYPWNTSSYGEPDGLLGINCRHHKYPFIPGVNIQRYFPTDDMDANNRLYKQTQIQRALERDVRKQKRACMMFDELGDKDAYEEAAVKLKAKEAKLKNYVDSHKNLHRREDREQVVGFDKGQSIRSRYAGKRLEESTYLRNNMPKNYKDERIIGKPISHKDLDVLLEKAREKGIKIGTPGNPTGGFEHYCGNTKVMLEVLDMLEKSIQDARKKGLYSGDVILKYDNVLGYKGDNSMVDIDAFAITRGHTITLNKFMFDDSKYLKKEYKQAVKGNMFTQGTDYLNIVNHEFGHIIDKKNKSLRRNILKVLRDMANSDNMELEDFVKKHVSLYAVERDKMGNLTYHELISELEAMRNGSMPDFAESLYRKVVN